MTCSSRATGASLEAFNAYRERTALVGINLNLEKTFLLWSRHGRPVPEELIQACRDRGLLIRYDHGKILGACFGMDAHVQEEWLTSPTAG